MNNKMNINNISVYSFDNNRMRFEIDDINRRDELEWIGAAVWLTIQFN